MSSTNPNNLGDIVKNLILGGTLIAVISGILHYENRLTKLETRIDDQIAKLDKTVQEKIQELEQLKAQVKTVNTQVDDILAGKIPPTPIIASVKITNPKEGASVPHAVTLEGTVENLPTNEELWIVKKIGNSYHPDRGPVFIDGKNWSGTAYVGNNQPGADTGRTFTILIVAASKETEEKYIKYLDEADAKGSYPGIPSLLGGKELKRITVIRDDSAAPTP
jgi:uncharacterized coiled-coil protein SlyX